jgi:hypothetical protein
MRKVTQAHKPTTKSRRFQQARFSGKIAGLAAAIFRMARNFSINHWGITNNI